MEFGTVSRAFDLSSEIPGAEIHLIANLVFGSARRCLFAWVAWRVFATTWLSCAMAMDSFIRSRNSFIEGRWKGGTWSELNRTKVYSISKKLNSAKVWVTLYI